MKISVLCMISLNGQVRVLDLVRMFDKGNTPSSFRRICWQSKTVRECLGNGTSALKLAECAKI